jgi:hypothetical protein
MGCSLKWRQRRGATINLSGKGMRVQCRHRLLAIILEHILSNRKLRTAVPSNISLCRINALNHRLLFSSHSNRLKSSLVCSTVCIFAYGGFIKSVQILLSKFGTFVAVLAACQFYYTCALYTRSDSLFVGHSTRLYHPIRYHDPASRAQLMPATRNQRDFRPSIS